jgi:NADH dehydrogenase [ubiquinone] 1 alpha subcomplex assembly factor 5
LNRVELREGNLEIWDCLQRNVTKDVLLAAHSIYREKYGVQENDLVGLPATYQILCFIGWKPDESQVKPTKRGSAKVSLKDMAS